ncbi:hypothetical protein T4D_5468 [Trichinella pseudospiralis]|uniref:Uncharacterized protein n=1 Tax=Trichinella pseudospiralis TaxID=6337 RepID=A0A0V1F3W4_TRIPS|nr:hypothetical protein T4D_5468 [Trichinella pseudospiralis]
MCRFLTTTIQEFQVGGAVLVDKQCTVRERQSAFHYPTSTTVHGNFLIYNYFPKNSPTYYSDLSGDVPQSPK